MPLTVSPTTTCPDIFTSLHTKLSLSVHAPLAHAPACSFTYGSAMSHPPCHTTYITYQTRSFQPRCPFGSTRPPLWFIYVFITARYTATAYVLTGRHLVRLCSYQMSAQDIEEGESVSQQNKPDRRATQEQLCLAYDIITNTPIAHISFSTRNKVVF